MTLQMVLGAVLTPIGVLISAFGFQRRVGPDGINLLLYLGGGVLAATGLGFFVS